MCIYLFSCLLLNKNGSCMKSTFMLNFSLHMAFQQCRIFKKYANFYFSFFYCSLSRII